MSNNKFDRGILYHIFIAVVLLLLWYAWRNPVFKLLLYVQDKLLSDVDQFIFGVLLIVLTVGILCHISKIERRKYLPNLLFVYSFPLVLVYGYYRFCTNDFIFWGVFGIAYADILVLPLLFLLGIKIYKSIALCRSEDSAKADSYILRDDPICRIEDDVLGYSSLVAYLYNDLKSVDLSKGSFSVGIAASWGKGKTSYMNLFQQKAEKNGDIVVWFNPRASKRVEDIQEDFFRQFSEALAEHHVGFALLVNRYLSALGLLEGIAWFSNAFHLFRTLSAADEKKRINRAIDNIGKNIYVFVDDLDRLTGTEILEVFKIIDKNADFHRTIFVAGYDKSYVNAVLSHHLGHGSATIYTDKYFGLEVSLPEPSPENLAECTDRYISERIKADGVLTRKKEVLRAWGNKKDDIIPHLDSLRHVKRYVNLFLSRYPRVMDKVDCGDYLLLTLLRYRDVDVYHTLSRRVFLATGDVNGRNRGRYYNCFGNEGIVAELEKLATWEGARRVVEELFLERHKLDQRQRIGEFRHIWVVEYFGSYFFEEQDVIDHEYLLGLLVDTNANQPIAEMKELSDEVNKYFAGGKEDYLRDVLYAIHQGKVNSFRSLQYMCVLLTYALKNYCELMEEFWGLREEMSQNVYMVAGVLLDIFSLEHSSKFIGKVGTSDKEYKRVLDRILPKMIEAAPSEIDEYLLKQISMSSAEGYKAIYSDEEISKWRAFCSKLLKKE